MKNSICLLLLLTILNSCNKHETAKAETDAPDFEGRIEYRLKFIPNTGKNIDTLKLREEFGEKSTFIIKQGAIRRTNESQQMALQLYLPKENRLYYTNKAQPEILFFYQCDKAGNKDFTSKVIKNADTILGYSCDKLVYTDEFGQKIDYYFASELKMDPKYTKQYSFLNKNKIAEIMKSVFLRQEYKTADYTLITEAIKVEKTKIDDHEFDKPKRKMIRER